MNAFTSYELLERYIASGKELRIHTFQSGNTTFCFRQLCSDCVNEIYCGGKDLPILSKDDMNKFKDEYPEYFI